MLDMCVSCAELPAGAHAPSLLAAADELLSTHTVMMVWFDVGKHGNW
jgi:hypothetical protein